MRLQRLIAALVIGFGLSAAAAIPVQAAGSMPTEPTGKSGHPGSAFETGTRSLNVQCGGIRSRRLSKATLNGRYSVFTYRYYRCRFARRLVRAYIRRTPRMVRCYRNQFLCGARIRGWKCQLGYLHGTVVGCVPRKARWEGTRRPFIGVSRSW